MHPPNPFVLMFFFENMREPLNCLAKKERNDGFVSFFDELLVCFRVFLFDTFMKIKK